MRLLQLQRAIQAIDAPAALLIEVMTNRFMDDNGQPMIDENTTLQDMESIARVQFNKNLDPINAWIDNSSERIHERLVRPDPGIEIDEEEDWLPLPHAAAEIDLQNGPLLQVINTFYNDWDDILLRHQALIAAADAEEINLARLAPVAQQQRFFPVQPRQPAAQQNDSQHQCILM